MIIKLLALKNAYVRNEDGATAIEYALLAAGVSLAIIGVIFAFGDQLNLMFTDLKDQLDAHS